MLYLHNLPSFYFTAIQPISPTWQGKCPTNKTVQKRQCHLLQEPNTYKYKKKGVHTVTDLWKLIVLSLVDSISMPFTNLWSCEQNIDDMWSRLLHILSIWSIDKNEVRFVSCICMCLKALYTEGQNPKPTFNFSVRTEKPESDPDRPGPTLYHPYSSSSF